MDLDEQYPGVQQRFEQGNKDPRDQPVDPAKTGMEDDNTSKDIGQYRQLREDDITPVMVAEIRGGGPQHADVQREGEGQDRQAEKEDLQADRME